MSRRRGAFAAGMFTFAVFLSPALLSPGPIEAANVAGVALAIWFASDAGKLYGRDDIRSTLAFRIAPVAPAIIGASAIIFAISILHGWNVSRGFAPPELTVLADRLVALWRFPLSPVSMFADPDPFAPVMSADAIRGVTLLLSAALLLGALFSLFTLLGRIIHPRTLREHALLWVGVKPLTAEQELEVRGARGLRPMGDPLSDMMRTPVSGRLALRATALVVAVVALPYAPAFFRIFSGLSAPEVQAFLESRLVGNQFFAIWLTGLWAVLIAASIILFTAYLRLSILLRLR